MVDYSATFVNKNLNLEHWYLINEFYQIINITYLLNTSFNENEPIVSNPSEAINCFLRTKMDILVISALPACFFLAR